MDSAVYLDPDFRFEPPAPRGEIVAAVEYLPGIPEETGHPIFFIDTEFLADITAFSEDPHDYLDPTVSVFCTPNASLFFIVA